MYKQNNIKKEEDYNVFTIRMSAEMQEMVEYLKNKKLINKSSVIRLAVAELYAREKKNTNLKQENLLC